MRHTIVAALLLLAAACGTPTESVCPQDSKLTYEGFGKPFLAKYCGNCHAADKAGDKRNGAPDELNFDDLKIVQAHVADIDRLAAGGPAAVNEWMPDDDPKPTEAERRQLGEWLACGAK